MIAKVGTSEGSTAGKGGNAVKIAIDVTPILPGGKCGGAKQLVLELLRGFAGRSHRDKFILLTSYKNHDVFLEFEALGMRRIRVQEDPFVKKKSLISRIFNRVKSELNFYVLPGLLKKNDVSVLFCPMTAPYYSEVGIPTVSIAYDLQHLFYPSFFSTEELANRNYLCSELKRKVDVVICISSFTRESVITKLDLPPERVISVPIAVHSRLKTFSQDEIGKFLDKYDLRNKKYFIFPANLWHHKNHKMLLVAFNMFVRIYPQHDLHLVLTGAIIENNEIMADATKQMGLDGKVHFLGYLPENELAAVWGCSYALLFPSLFEGFGIPLVEAMMFGKPIVASNATSIPEVAGDAALYFDPRKPDEILDCLGKIVEDRDLYYSLAAKGQAQLKRFDFDKMVDEYLSVLHNAAERAPLVHFIEVAGIYGDGWAGPSIHISFHASNDDRLLEMDVFLPEWHPNDASKIRLVRSDGKRKNFSLDKKKPLKIMAHLPKSAGSWTMAISGGFVPGGSDMRTLTCMIQGMFIVDEGSSEKIYDFKN